MQCRAVEEVMVSNIREKKNTERSDTKLPSHLLMQPEATGLFFGMECSNNMSEVGPCYAMTNTTLL